MGLASLPEDILLEITLFLSVFDVLSLRQTCRSLHAFGSSDYLWHRLVDHLELPLDVPPGVPLNDLPHEELQQTVIKAIRLEANWRAKTPSVKRIRALVRDTNDPYVDEMQFVPGGKWLLTAQRHRQMEGRWSSRIVLWSLETVEDPYRTASIDISGRYRSSALELQEGGKLATLAVGLSDGTDMIEVYTISLQDRAEFSYFLSPPLVPSRKILLPSFPRASHISPVIHQLAILQGRIVATVVVPGGNLSLQVFIADTRSRFSGWVHPRSLESFSSLWVRLHDGHFLLLGTTHASLILRIYKIPSKHMLDTGDRSDDGQFVDLGPVLAEYEQPLRQDSEFHDVSRVSLPSSSQISVVLFYSFHDSSTGMGQVTRFPLPLSSRGTNAVAATRCFSMPPQVSAQLAQIGASGRAVWVEHNWETQNRRIMRYQPRNGDTIGVLLPSDPALPFTPNLCHSLAFDEVTGRVCLGLFNGDVYILDLV